jgi:hypothetical protein
MYEYKYVNKSKRNHPDNNGRPCQKKWITGEDPMRRDKYYCWMKHRSQANYRKQEHDITWEEFESLWTDELWENRGRGVDGNSMIRIDTELGWTVDNVYIGKKIEYLQRASEYRDHD